MTFGGKLELVEFEIKDMSQFEFNLDDLMKNKIFNDSAIENAYNNLSYTENIKCLKSSDDKYADTMEKFVNILYNIPIDLIETDKYDYKLNEYLKPFIQNSKYEVRYTKVKKEYSDKVGMKGYEHLIQIKPKNRSGYRTPIWVNFYFERR